MYTAHLDAAISNADYSHAEVFALLYFHDEPQLLAPELLHLIRLQFFPHLE